MGLHPRGLRNGRRRMGLHPNWYGRTAAANNCSARRVPREGRQRLQQAAAVSLSAGARNPESSPTYFPKAWAIWPTSLAQPISMAA
jgi:hypothetical protein